MKPRDRFAHLRREDGSIFIEYGVIIAVIALFLASSGTLVVQAAQDMVDRIGLELTGGLGEPAAAEPVPDDPPPGDPAAGDPPPGDPPPGGGGGGGGGKAGETPGHGKGSGGGKDHK